MTFLSDTIDLLYSVILIKHYYLLYSTQIIVLQLSESYFFSPSPRSYFYILFVSLYSSLTWNLAFLHLSCYRWVCRDISFVGCPSIYVGLVFVTEFRLYLGVTLWPGDALSFTVHHIRRCVMLSCLVISTVAFWGHGNILYYSPQTFTQLFNFKVISNLQKTCKNIF